MRRLLSLLLAAGLWLPAWAPASGESPSVSKSAAAEARHEDSVVLRFTKHALSRMQERGLSALDVRATVDKGETFPYYHQGKWKTGYYDPDKKLFIATDHGVVITVFAGASRKYVEGLKRKKP
jgi:hypothetical protein